MPPDDPDRPDRADRPDDGVDAREQARIRRRDRDAAAAARDLMRPGMGKVFKQILDARGQAAKASPKSRKRRGA